MVLKGISSFNIGMNRAFYSLGCASTFSKMTDFCTVGRYRKDETIAIHGGYTTDPTTHVVTAPIYQTVVYEFDDAQHGAIFLTWCSGTFTAVL